MYIKVNINGRDYTYETSLGVMQGDLVKVPFGDKEVIGEVSGVDTEAPLFGDAESVTDLANDGITDVVTALSVRDITEVSKMKVDVERVWARLDKMLPDPKSLVVTEDNYKDVKTGVLRTLRSAAKDIDEARKTPQRAFNEAKAQYEAAMTELHNRVVERVNGVKALTDEFDEKIKHEHEEIAKAAIEQATKDFALEKEFADSLIVRPEYLNLTSNKKTICNSVRKDAEQLALAQQDFHTRMASLEANVAMENETLANPLVAEDYRNMVRESSIAMRPMSEITERIRCDAENRRELERRAVEQAKRSAELKAKAAEEAEARAKAAEEARILQDAQEEKELNKQEEIVEKTLIVKATNNQISQIMSFAAKLGAKVSIGF